MSWKNIVKGQEPKDDPRIQGFLSRHKPEYESTEVENKITSIKEANKFRMELAEKMLDEDGYINMLEFFDSKPPSLWGTPLSFGWIDRDMFYEKAPRYYGPLFLPSRFAAGISPFFFDHSGWDDTSKKEKLELFRELLPSEEGGIKEPIRSRAKPTYAEEEMLGRDVFDNEDDPRKRPINPDSGTFPMGFSRKPFGEEMKNKSWENLLLKQYKNEDLAMIAIPSKANTLVDKIKNKTLPKRMTRKRIREAMTRIMETEDWEVDDEMRDSLLASAEKVIEALDETRQQPQNKMTPEKLNDMLEQYLQGHHEELENYISHPQKSTRSRRKSELNTFLNASETDDIPFDKLKDYVQENEELQSTEVGKLVGLQPEFEGEATVSDDDLNDERRLVRYVQHVITTNMDNAARNRRLPSTRKGKNFDTILGGKRILRYPALEYILNNEDLDLTATDFKAESPSRLQEALVMEDLAAGLGEKNPSGLQAQYNTWVKRQSTTKPTSKVESQERVGRLRGTNTFRQKLSDEYLDEFNRRMKSKKIAGMTGLPTEDWEALAAFARGEQVDNLHNRAKDGGILPIGRLNNARKVRRFFSDDNRKEAFLNMKELGGRRRLTDDNARNLLSDLFYESGTAEDTMSRTFKSSKKDIAYQLNDGVLDVNQLTPQDVIELLREMEFAYRGRSSMNVAFSAFKREPDVKKAVQALLTETKKQYKNIRNDFLNAVKQKIIEESKNPDGFVRKWLIGEQGQ